MAETVLLLNRETPGWDYICSDAKRGHFFFSRSVLFISNFIMDILHTVDFLRRKESVMDCVMKVFEMEPERELFIRNLPVLAELQHACLLGEDEILMRKQLHNANHEDGTTCRAGL